MFVDEPLRNRVFHIGGSLDLLRPSRIPDFLPVLTHRFARERLPGKRYEDREPDDPAEAASLDEVRAIRDDVDTRIKALVDELVAASPE